VDLLTLTELLALTKMIEQIVTDIDVLSALVAKHMAKRHKVETEKVGAIAP
jgi:hypothetical protein